MNSFVDALLLGLGFGMGLCSIILCFIWAAAFIKAWKIETQAEKKKKPTNKYKPQRVFWEIGKPFPKVSAEQIDEMAVKCGLEKPSTKPWQAKHDEIQSEYNITFGRGKTLEQRDRCTGRTTKAILEGLVYMSNGIPVRYAAVTMRMAYMMRETALLYASKARLDISELLMSAKPKEYMDHYHSGDTMSYVVIKDHTIEEFGFKDKPCNVDKATNSDRDKYVMGKWPEEEKTLEDCKAKFVEPDCGALGYPPVLPNPSIAYPPDNLRDARRTEEHPRPM